MKGVHCELIDLLHAFISASFITTTMYANVKKLNRIFELITRLLLSLSLIILLIVIVIGRFGKKFSNEDHRSTNEA